MTPEATAIAPTPGQAPEAAPAGAAAPTIDDEARGFAEIADTLRPLAAFAPHAPAMFAILMDAVDDAMRTAGSRGIDVERGLLNGAEAALRFGATMDAEKVRALDALLHSGVLAPATLQVIGELGRALTETAATRPAPTGAIGLVKALAQPDVQRALGFLVTFAERFGRRLRELPAAQG